MVAAVPTAARSITLRGEARDGGQAGIGHDDDAGGPNGEYKLERLEIGTGTHGRAGT